MAFGSTGSMANLMSRAKFRVGMGFMPGAAKHSVPVGGSVLAMTSTDKARQAATWEFMKFMTNPDEQLHDRGEDRLHAHQQGGDGASRTPSSTSSSTRTGRSPSTS